MNEYGISSRDYLARAKACLAEKDCKFLFYAAFEIRCGVEARMEEYLYVQEHISKKKRQGWKVAQLAKNIEDVFRIGQKNVVLFVLDPISRDVLIEARYTPVKKSLQKQAKKLGNYLHSAKKPILPGSPVWAQLRMDLESAVIDLEQANSGNLLGPALLSPDGKINIKLELSDPDLKENAKTILFDGANLLLEIKYE